MRNYKNHSGDAPVKAKKIFKPNSDTPLDRFEKIDLLRKEILNSPLINEQTTSKDFPQYPNSGTADAFSGYVSIDETDTIPVLTSIPSEPWMEQTEDNTAFEAEEWIPRYGVNGNHIIAIRVQGDSMEPNLHEGDLLIVNPERAFTKLNGGIGVVSYNSSIKIRKVYLSGDNYTLMPSNPDYEPETIPVTSTTIYKIKTLVRENSTLF